MGEDTRGKTLTVNLGGKTNDTDNRSYVNGSPLLNTWVHVNTFIHSQAYIDTHTHPSVHTHKEDRVTARSLLLIHSLHGVRDDLGPSLRMKLPRRRSYADRHRNEGPQETGDRLGRHHYAELDEALEKTIYHVQTHGGLDPLGTDD